MVQQFDNIPRYLIIVYLIIGLAFVFGGLKARAQGKQRFAWSAVMLTIMASWIPVNLWLQRHDSALLHAVIAGDVPAARMAFEEGGHINMPIKDHFTLLQVAARQGSVEMAKFLIQHGADVTAISDNGDTALKIAIANDHPEMVAYLQSLMGTNYTNHFP